MYTPKLYSKATVYRYSYYYDYHIPKEILKAYRSKENVSTSLEYFNALSALLESKGYTETKEGNEWFKDDFTYKTEKVTSRYIYDQEDGTVESVRVLQFTLIHWDKWNRDNVSYEILFHLPYCIKTRDKEIYLEESIEGILSSIEKEMSSIMSRENP